MTIGGMFDWIAPYVRGRILDIGGGACNHLAFLRHASVVSIEVSPECVEELRARYREVSNCAFEVGDAADSALVDCFGPSAFDTVPSCNVFEHIADDERAFMHAARLLAPGGCLVLLLPAHAWLYGSMDRLEGHYRRYSRDEAAGRLAKAGLQRAVVKYVNPIGALGWLVNNRFLPHRELSSDAINGQIRVFDRLVIPMLRRFEGVHGARFGQSLVCVGRKPAIGR
jgi:SAM-dependent methyltransferase